MPDNTNTSSTVTQTSVRYSPLFINVSAGLFTGTLCTVLFNPWDRALYLSVKNQRPFLSMVHFSSPYQGMSQAIFQRGFFGSIYYVMQGEMKVHLHPYLHHQQGLSESATQFCIGTTAGCINGALTNPMSAVKYHTWGKAGGKFISSVQEMVAHGGWRSFCRGTQATLGRDMVFGSTYEVLRHLLQDAFPKPNTLEEASVNFIYNGAAAALATIAASPFNYARNMQYAASTHQASKGTVKIIKAVIAESQARHPSLIGKACFFQQRLGIGWGTGRVAVGMAVGQKVFDLSRDFIEKPWGF